MHILMLNVTIINKLLGGINCCMFLGSHTCTRSVTQFTWRKWIYKTWKETMYSGSICRFCFIPSIIYSLFTVRSLPAWTDQFMRKQRIKFSLNDNPLLASPEKTNGAPRWCFNITNCLGVPGKVTDVAPRMKKGWGAGQGHHTPRLGSDKHCWLGFGICPKATKRRRGQRGERFVHTTVLL